MMSRFVQFEGLVRFFCGNISTSNGSRTSHSASVKLLEYGIVTSLNSNNDLTSSHSQMSNGFYTDWWGAYERHLPQEMHSIGKRNTQKIERKHLGLRTRIKRLTRKTICFSKSEVMHDLVIGLFINRYEFGLPI